MSKKRKKPKGAFKPWMEFERAVNSFLQTLLMNDPNAVVTFNPPKKDRDTKEKQQVDAWIEYKIGGHIPIKMLVSCKDHGRKIDVGGIRTFLSEIEDSGASTGAIYSRSGFTKSAVTKASAHGVGCFQLWRDRPADQPMIELYRRYWCWDSVNAPVVEPGDVGFPAKTWDEFFKFRVALDGPEQSLAEYLEGELKKAKEIAMKENNEPTALVFPQDFRLVVDLEDGRDRGTKISIECRWLKYQGKLCASLLNGSYCVGTGHFAGTESAPFPVTYPPPPSDWEQLA